MDRFLLVTIDTEADSFENWGVRLPFEFRSVPAGGVNGSTPGKYYSVVCKNCGHSIGRIFSIENEDGEEAALRKWNNHS